MHPKNYIAFITLTEFISNVCERIHKFFYRKKPAFLQLRNLYIKKQQCSKVADRKNLSCHPERLWWNVKDMTTCIEGYFLLSVMLFYDLFL